MEKVRSLLFDSKLNKELWGEALFAATYIVNRLPSSSINDEVPAEKWKKRKVDYSRLQVFGTTCYAKDLTHLRKLDPRSKKYILVGYAPNSYRLWDEKKRKTILSRDVTFLGMRQDLKTTETESPVKLRVWRIKSTSPACK